MPNHPVVAAYISDFLKKDMLHVYRQITAFRQLACHVFTHKRENEDYFPYHHKRLHLLPRPRLRWWRRLVHRQLRQEPWQLYRWELRHLILELTRIDAQVMHLYFGHIAPQFLPLMKAWPHPVIVSFHGADGGVDLNKPRHLDALRQVFRHGSRMLCRSESLASDLKSLGCPPEKIILWRTGIPLDEWPFQPLPAPPDGRWNLLQACRFIDKKGLDLTLAAFATVHRQHPNARLTLVGDGPLKESLHNQAAVLGLANAICFPGFLTQHEVRLAIQKAHLFLHPSRTSKDGNREGVPNAALEAMASGVPVIGTTHGGFPEAITDGVSGLLVAENDVPALANAALNLLSNDLLRQTIAGKGRQVIEEIFDRDLQVRLLEDCYKDLMHRR